MSKIHRLLGLSDDIPILNADFDFLIQVKVCDVKRAVRGDSRNCAIAKAAKRQTSCSAILRPGVAIYRRVGYLELMRKGKHGIFKFMVDVDANRALKLFDETGKFPEGGIWLRALPASWDSTHRRLAAGTGTPHGPRKVKPRDPKERFWRGAAPRVVPEHIAVRLAA